MRYLFSIFLLAGAMAFAQEIKGPDGNEGTGIFRGTGGPDAFGYIWDDGVPYQFVDISGTGTMIASGDDVISALEPLSEPFSFYGVVYNSMAGGSNGFLTNDTASAGDLSNDCPLPVSPSTGAGFRIYPLHDDLISDIFMEYFATCPRSPDQAGAAPSCTIFQWVSTHFGGGGPWSAQVILYHGSGEMLVQVGPGNPETGSGSTTGIQNDGATIGLTFACDTAGSVPDMTAVAFLDSNFQGITVPTMQTKMMIFMAALLALAGVGFAIRQRLA